MDLVARVRQALREQVIHPTEFERCACALLQSQYPGLAAVEGGHDFGRDADIYFPLGTDDVDARGRLLVTTGDPVANLRTGLRRMREEGVRADLIVMACSRAVDANTRAAMDRLCERRSLPAAHIYAQEWFVDHLVREPAWRWNLLRIAADLGALLDRPLEAPDHVTDQTPLVGRESTIAMLDSEVDAGRDTVVVGVPGVGKTRLTAELDRRVVYLEQTQLDRLIDELLQARPDAVVVDEAHVRLDDIRVLRRARRQADLSFVIVAPTWPDRADEVMSALPGAVRVDVDLLERADMNRLVTSVGVTGHRARAVVLAQADGRPGWALTLCELLATGEGDRVVTGRAHLANVERHLRRVTESETAVDTLACVAALGGASTETLYALAPLVGEPPASMSGLMERLARNGLVETVGDVWSLQPALRAPLVARWFFTTPAGRPWSTVCDAFPERASDLALAVMSAARVSDSPAARAAAEAWVRALPAPTDWDTDIFAVVSEFAHLDRRAAEFAVAAAHAVLDGPRDVHQLSGVSVDLAGDAAVRQLIQSAEQFLLPEAVAGLLDLAVGDHRPRHSTPQHPLRVLSDLAGIIDPDFGTEIEIRRLLLRSALDWLRTHREASHWAVATEMLASIFTVEVSGNWTDPGAPNTVTMSRGIDRAENLAQLISLWEQVAAVLDAADEWESPYGCPPSALVPLLDLALTWLRLGEGHATGHAGPSDEQKRLGVEGGSRILATLYPLLQASPGLVLRAQRMLDSLRERDGTGRELPSFNVDPDLEAFAGRGWWSHLDAADAAEPDQPLSVEALAQKIAELGPYDGVARFGELAEQSALAGDQTGGIWVAEQMTPLLSDPSAWYEAAAAAGNPLLLRSALGQWLKTDPTTVPRDILARCLDNPDFRSGVISVVLGRAEIDESAEFVIAAMRKEDVGLLDSLFLHDEPEEVLQRLLLHPIAAIASSAAVSFAIGQRHGPSLPEAWRPAWREAVQHMRVEDLPQHSQWRAGQLLGHLAESDPDLFEAWFTERLDEMTDRGFFTPLEPRGCEAHLATLSQTHRYRLAIRCAGLPRIGPSPLIQLVGPDRDLAERLLHEGEVTADQLLEALSGQRNEILESLGPLLLDHGVPAAHIAATAAWYDTWWGPASARHQELIDYFTTLSDGAS
ncbi:hypothetical protein V1460_02260 [Streptomyces sp. SCSIO 30461]|uniref:hypothetical protein n=1 Tax=Streptomyces sp. SCSIO 30461 TaxID=3118085 RepID=UPI0030CBF105